MVTIQQAQRLPLPPAATFKSNKKPRETLSVVFRSFDLVH
jgi:hypothetical protein